MLRNDRTIRLLLAVVAVLLAANLFVQLGSRGVVRSAQAAGGIPDSGAQMQQVIDQLTQLNGKVDKLQSLLESGKLTVKVDAPPSKDK